ncbi:MAG TPA: dienelactone hydrolase family protein [Steroidobacteraceae bacterium]
MKIRVLLIALGAAVAAFASAPEPIEDLQWLFIEDTVALISPPTQAIGERARTLMDRAAAAREVGALSEMRRALAEARVILGGGEWNAENAFVASLAIRPHETVIDPATPAVIAVGQYFHAMPPSRDPLTFELGVRTWRPRAPFDENVRWLTTRTTQALDLLENPQRIVLPAHELKDGSYDVVVRAVQGGRVLGTTARRVFVVERLKRDLETIEARASAVKLTDAMRASIQYPADVVKGLNDGTRQVRAFDFRAAIARAYELLEAAEAGKDPLTRAKGNLERHYWLPESQRIEPYRLIVPQRWDGRSALPLVVVLHGSNGDHNSVLAQPKLIEEAEARGWALLSPMGYSPNSGWGNHLPVVLANGTMPRPRPSTIGGIVLPQDGVDPEPGERDVLTTIELVRSEYPIDARRIYLIGNSMGGEGTWHLAAKYPHLWAAVAPAAGAIDPDRYPYAALGRLPVLAVHGTADDIVSYDASRTMVQRLQRHGGNAHLLSVLDGGHDAVYNVVPQVFDFFAAHARDDGSSNAR